jgi:hypothetical protein
VGTYGHSDFKSATMQEASQKLVTLIIVPAVAV